MVQAFEADIRTKLGPGAPLGRFAGELREPVEHR